MGFVFESSGEWWKISDAHVYCRFRLGDSHLLLVRCVRDE